MNERNNGGETPDPEAAPEAEPVEAGDIESGKDEPQPTPTAEQFQEDKPAAPVEPADKASTQAAEETARPAAVENAAPDVPVEQPAALPSIPEPSQVAGWQLAGGAARQTVAEQRRAERIALAPIREEHARRAEVSRRNFMRAGFWAAMGMTIAGTGYCAKETIWPQNVTGFGGQFIIPADSIPGPDDIPIRSVQLGFPDGRFWLSHIPAGYGADSGFGEPSDQGGLLALYQKCPHLGCTVPFRENFSFDDQTGNWFRCPCHGSTYNRAGIRVFGPAPRPMDVMHLEVLDDGSVLVDTNLALIVRGSDENPNLAVPYDSSAFLPGSGGAGPTDA
jgi:cytochrome b6-f complex iron-sulfur subunit